jgi:hypothetical protein
MVCKVRSKKSQKTRELDAYAAYLQAAEDAKTRCYEALGLLVDEIREEISYEPGEELEVLVNASRVANLLSEWAVLSAPTDRKIRQDKVNELQDVQLVVAKYFTET